MNLARFCRRFIAMKLDEQVSRSGNVEVGNSHGLKLGPSRRFGQGWQRFVPRWRHAVVFPMPSITMPGLPKVTPLVLKRRVAAFDNPNLLCRRRHEQRLLRRDLLSLPHGAPDLLRRPSAVGRKRRLSVVARIKKL